MAKTKKKKLTISQIVRGADYGKLPMPVERMAAAICKSNPSFSKSKCIQIAVGRLQDYGYLKKGTFKLTKKGKSLAGKMSKREPTAPDVLLKWHLGKKKWVLSDTGKVKV